MRFDTIDRDFKLMRRTLISTLTETVSGAATGVAKTMLGGLLSGLVLVSILPSFDEDGDDATFLLLFMSQDSLSIGLPVLGAGLGGLWYGGRALVHTLWSRPPQLNEAESVDEELGNGLRQPGLSH
jgi:hypothetical protein